MRVLMAFLFILLATPALAQNVSGIYYNEARNGEGLFVIHNEVQQRIVFSLYTFDPAVEVCDTIPEVTYQPAEGDPVIVRAEDEICRITGNDSAWYTGTADWDNGAFGEVYKATAYDYPMAFFSEVAEVEIVGLFVLDAIEGDGMRILIVPHATENAPDTLYGAYEFERRLFKPESAE